MDFALGIAIFVFGFTGGALVTYAWLADRVSATPDVPVDALTVEDVARGAGA